MGASQSALRAQIPPVAQGNQSSYRHPPNLDAPQAVEVFVPDVEEIVDRFRAQERRNGEHGGFVERVMK